jgi:hypothetical protein
MSSWPPKPGELWRTHESWKHRGIEEDELILILSHIERGGINFNNLIQVSSRSGISMIAVTPAEISLVRGV